VAFAPAAPLFAWPTDRTLHVFDLDGRPVARLATALDKSIRVFAFDPNGTKVAIGSYGTGIQVWSLDDGGRLLTTLKGHLSEINSLQFNGNGKRLLTSSSDGTVRQFTVETGDLLVEAEHRIARTLTKEEIDRYAVPLPLRFRPARPTRISASGADMMCAKPRPKLKSRDEGRRPSARRPSFRSS
jgi:WD40 repeat protein